MFSHLLRRFGAFLGRLGVFARLHFGADVGQAHHVAGFIGHTGLRQGHVQRNGAAIAVAAPTLAPLTNHTVGVGLYPYRQTVVQVEITQPVGQQF